MFRNTRSKFLKVKCPKCNNEQDVFSGATTKVDCLVCNKQVLAEPKGGKAIIHGKIIEEL